MYDTLFDAFRESVRIAPDNEFFCVPKGLPYAPDGIRRTYAEVAEEVGALIADYRAAGFATGHRVGLLLEARPVHFIHFLALNALGVSQVPINPDHRVEEMRYQFSHSAADMIVCLESYAPTVREAAGLTEKKPPVVTIEDWPSSLPPVTPRPDAPAPSPSTEAALMYTSGTTGLPKGCILTNEYWQLFSQWYLDFAKDPGSIFQLRQGKERLMNPLPVYHVAAGSLCFTSMMLTQGCYILPGRFSAARWWDTVRETGATLLHYIGLVPAALLKQPPSPRDRDHNVRWGLGAGLEPDLQVAFEKRFGFPNVEVWGMTEIAAFTAAESPPRHLGTRHVGRAIRDLKIRIVDDEEKDLPPGTPGQLLVRFDNPRPRFGFFDGYLNNPEATEDAWRGGWFHTGDICMLDEAGDMFFVDRKKNIIRRSGENIAAGEIEALLLSDPSVAFVAVIAAQDDLRQEEVYACIVPTSGAAGDRAHAERLFALCADKLAYYKAPGWILFLDSLPMTETQKVRKTNIFAQGEDPRTHPDVFDFRNLKKRGT
ncbi:MAG: AMP-binding protein [Flavobacteriaceae bacterium]